MLGLVKKCDQWMTCKHDVYDKNFQQFQSNHEITETNKAEQKFLVLGLDESDLVPEELELED